MRGLYCPVPVRKSTKREVGPKLHRRTDRGRVLPSRVGCYATGPFEYFSIVSESWKGCRDICCKHSAGWSFALILTMARVDSPSP